jgi:hypothetical protein
MGRRIPSRLKAILAISKMRLKTIIPLKIRAQEGLETHNNNARSISHSVMT